MLSGPPEAVRECIIRNQTVSSFLVDCIPGYDGGLEQAFHLIVNDVVGKKLLSNVTQRKKPSFFVNGLLAGSSFQINIYSSNAKGNSKSVLLTGTTLPLSSSSAFGKWHWNVMKIKFDLFVFIWLYRCEPNVWVYFWTKPFDWYHNRLNHSRYSSHYNHYSYL